MKLDSNPTRLKCLLYRHFLNKTKHNKNPLDPRITSNPNNFTTNCAPTQAGINPASRDSSIFKTYLEGSKGPCSQGSRHNPCDYFIQSVPNFTSSTKLRSARFTESSIVAKVFICNVLRRKQQAILFLTNSTSLYGWQSRYYIRLTLSGIKGSFTQLYPQELLSIPVISAETY